MLGIAGIVFPYRRPDLFDSGPLRSRIVGIPVVSLVSLVATAVWTFVFVILATQDVLGANTNTGWIALAIIVGAGILIYPIAVFVNRSRGIDLRDTFSELPPE